MSGAGEIDSIVERVRERWLAEGVRPEPGASAEEVSSFEERYAVRLPADVRAFFGAMNGTGEYIDAEAVSWWPLRRVRTIAEELPDDRPVPPAGAGHFCFVDYSVWCNAYALRLTADPDQPAPVVAVYAADLLVPIAPSFRDFLAMYLADSYAVLHPR